MGRAIKYLTAVLVVLVSGIASAGQGIWQGESTLARNASSRASLFQVDDGALRAQLSLTPQETPGDRSHTIQLPMPDGNLQRFAIVESSIMEPALAARYPEIKTYQVYGVDDPTAFGRADINSQGFHAMLFTANGRLFIDPDHTSAQNDQYLSRYRSGQSGQGFSCGVHQMESRPDDQPEFLPGSVNRIPENLLIYRLAVAATEEYVTARGGTIMLAQAAIVTAINRVNAIYERDLGIRLTLVGNNDQLIENGGNVQFNNNNAFLLLLQNQAWIDSEIGSAAYDVGHVFSTSFGGVAALGSVCSNSSKAQGTSGTAGQGDPLDDAFYIDYVAHEIGHQFNANHSFNGTTGSCGVGNRNSATAFEPGSGSTIMAYAGICAIGMNETENLQTNSDATFHAGSISEIDSFTRGAGSCYSNNPLVPTGNMDPLITAIAGKSIPANTPFVLDGAASDPEMDALTYQWDQMDAGCPTYWTSFGTDNGSNALFRSYVPRGDSLRNFPALGTQVQGRFDKAEVLPCHNRDLDFRLTARDGNSGQAIEDVRVSVDNSAGPFKITNLNTAPFELIFAGTEFAVNWDVANTNMPPINCANVDFDLITFSTGESSYSIHPLVATTNNSNDGNEMVTLNPATATTLIPATTTHLRSRVRVKCSDNIFYDLSDVDLRLVNTMVPPVVLSDADFTAYSFVTPALAMATVAPACPAVAECTTPTAVDSGKKSGGGSGALGYLWLLLLSAIIAVVKLFRRYGLQ